MFPLCTEKGLDSFTYCNLAFFVHPEAEMLAQQDYSHFQHHSCFNKHGSSCTRVMDGASALELPDCKIASENRNSPRWRIPIFLQPAYGCPAYLTKDRKKDQVIII